MQRLEIWPGASGDGSVAATSGPLFESLACLQRGALAGGEGSLQAAQRPDFGEHLAAGTITIVVRSTTPAQQSIATRTLLSQSSHRVKTYEFTSAAGEKPA